LLSINISLYAIAFPFVYYVTGLSFVLLFFFLQFFRNPDRVIAVNKNHILSPADGKVVVIEETEEQEYFKDKRIQISIFMSPINVHANKHPTSGIVTYSQYHKGKYLMAWNPKSSTENERHTIVIKNNKIELLVRQIAGFVARRIVNYLKVNEEVEQGKELGFIKFGSRVDILLPPQINVNVKLGDQVKAGITILAQLN